MKLSPQEVDHLAHLARMALNDEEKNKFSQQLSDILAYVGELNKLDTSGIAVTARVGDLVNVLEEDKVQPCSVAREELLANAPALENGYVKVKAVLE